MALKPCPNCGNFISDKAKRCPKCGIEITEDSFSETPPSRTPEDEEEFESAEYIDETPSVRKYWLILLIIIVIGILIGVIIYLKYGNSMKPDYESQYYREQDTNVEEQIGSIPSRENKETFAANDTKAVDSIVSKTGDTSKNKKSTKGKNLTIYAHCV